MPKTEIVFLALLMVIANFVSAQSKTLIEINNPFINLSYPDKSIAIKALSTKNIEGNKFILEGPAVEIKSQGLTLDLRSAEALFDKTKNILELNREAKLLSDKGRSKAFPRSCTHSSRRVPENFNFSRIC